MRRILASALGGVIDRDAVELGLLYVRAASQRGEDADNGNLERMASELEQILATLNVDEQDTLH